jgi:hypothetical protein
VIIYDKEALTKEVFPAYFKHSNFKSFARQLNFYGFRKIKSKDKECCIYHHEYFQINRADLLPHIQRQTNENHQDMHPIPGTQNVPTTVIISDEVKELKDNVRTLTATVSTLHQEIDGLKALVASLADVIRVHDEFIRQIPIHQVVHPSTVSTPVHAVHVQATFDQNEANEESRKPQAKQISFSNHNVSSTAGSIQNEPSPFAYVAMEQRSDHESRHSKRQKISSENSVAYAANVSHDQLSVTPSSSTQNNVIKPDFDGRHDHWTAHTTDDYIDLQHHNHLVVQNQQQAHNISLNSIDNQNSSATSTSHAVVECSADQDYGYEDLAWFALFEEDISHQPDDPTAAPQA